MTLGVMQAPFDSSQTGLSAAQFFAALQVPDSKTWYVELEAQRVVPSLSVEEHSPELQVRMQAESPLAQQGLDSQTPAALQISRSPARLQRLAPAVHSPLPAVAGLHLFVSTLQPFAQSV